MCKWKTPKFFPFGKLAWTFALYRKCLRQKWQKFCGKKIIKMFTTSYTQCWIIVLNCRQWLWVETWVRLIFSAKYSYMNRKCIMHSTSVGFCCDIQKSCNVFFTLLWLKKLKTAIIFGSSKAVNILKIHVPMESHSGCKKKKKWIFSLDYIFVCHWLKRTSILSEVFYCF